jgi:hypothetical protein
MASDAQLVLARFHGTSVRVITLKLSSNFMAYSMPSVPFVSI